MILQDWMCEEHGVFEALADNAEVEAVPCPKCGRASAWAPSPVCGRAKIAELVRGGSDERPPFVLDTSELGDGMPMAEWREKRRKVREEERRARVRELSR